MHLKKSSLIFLVGLLIILVFIIGVRRGQQVEKKNKVIDFIISLPPSPTTQPTQIPLDFKAYKHSGCRIQFLHPSFLRKTSESSTSAKLEGNFQSIQFDCSKNSADKLLSAKNLATAEVQLKGKNVNAKVRPTELKEDEASPTLLFTSLHTSTRKPIFYEVSKSLYLLFEKTLEFTP